MVTSLLDMQGFQTLSGRLWEWPFKNKTQKKKVSISTTFMLFWVFQKREDFSRVNFFIFQQLENLIAAKNLLGFY